MPNDRNRPILDREDRATIKYSHCVVLRHIHIHIHSHSFYCTRKSVQYKHTIQTEIQIQQEEAKAHRAYRRPVPKFSC